MKPTQALQKDWRMYYDSTLMLHSVLGVVYVSAREGELKAQQVLDKGAPLETVAAKDLTVWWPRAGAYNYTAGRAVYIERHAHRCMKKSAQIGTHYLIKWGNPNVDVARALARGPNFISWEHAKAAFDKALISSVAITRETILKKEEDKYDVIYRGNPVGSIENGLFVPTIDRAPTTKLVLIELEREGVIL